METEISLKGLLAIARAIDRLTDAVEEANKLRSVELKITGAAPKRKRKRS